MDGLVKLIFAFWIIVILGVILAAIIANPWLLIIAAVILIVGIAYLIKNRQDEKEKKKQDEENKNARPLKGFLADNTTTQTYINEKTINTNNQYEVLSKSAEGTLHALNESKQQYLKDNKDKIDNLTKKYCHFVYNFIENITEVSHDVFANIDTKFPDTPNDTNILISPYWQSASLLLKTKFKYDGFGFYNYDTVIKNGYTEAEELQNLAKFFVDGLKKRIIEQNEWVDVYTLPIVLYFIIRNNVIKYHHDLYVEEVGYENIEYFCGYQTTTQIEDNKVYFAYYYIYQTDINLPFVETYNELCFKIETEQKKQKQEGLENILFGKGKELTDDDLPEELRLENLPMKPIEKVDVMTGEEFERYMEKYFIKKGYKVIRTPLSGDYGIDLIIEHEFGKIGVQLKCYFDKVPLKAVQEVVAGLRHYGLGSGMVITNSYFQPSAIRLANDNSITLWDRDTLIEKLEV